MKGIFLNKAHFSFKNIIYYIDFILLVFVIVCLLEDIVRIIYSLINHFNLLRLIDFKDIFLNMENTSTGNQEITSHSTNVSLIHNDGNWSNTIRSLFIYGSGVLRYTAVRSGGAAAASEAAW